MKCGSAGRAEERSPMPTTCSHTDLTMKVSGFLPQSELYNFFK
ncbi:Uncharacterized protein dnm_030480 [Desulfonema magnum]|uniref:Uncharacterized protein n=1 Tax=Desulfonema magnum TaxID=45655 RepID=A0A975BKE3_9BACT|nr:Uncharacterized protein dnm_030480 [Desulfonema magnum]